ncbi:MAG: DUF1244 domain-containing protein [Hyphomicrobium sp.]
MSDPDDRTRIELEAAAFRRLLAHLSERSDVQNIDLMNLAGFCRNCLANWYAQAAAEREIAISREAAREIVYGMPFAEWQARHQKEAAPDALAAFEKNRPAH